MVFILKPNVPKEKIDKFITEWEQKGFSTIYSVGTEHTAICLIGNTMAVDLDHVVQTNDIIDFGKRITEQFKAVNRTVHEDDTIVKVGDVSIGEGFFPVIAGPCSVETHEQVLEIAKSIKQSGAKILRGGAFKPRTSPYAFQGKQVEGLDMLRLAKKETGLPIVSEIMNQTQIDLFDDVDMVQIGARNMQNYDLLKVVGKLKKPVLLKRGYANTLEELLMSAEYIMAEGNKDVILCERGIRTFETRTRNTLDPSAVPVLRELTHLPIIVDPSHAIGISRYVKPMAFAAVACGADGLIIEVHNDPENAACDGAQSLTPEQFSDLSEGVNQIRKVVKTL